MVRDGTGRARTRAASAGLVDLGVAQPALVQAGVDAAAPRPARSWVPCSTSRPASKTKHVVGVLGGREPVRDRDGGPAGGEAAQRLGDARARWPGRPRSSPRPGSAGPGRRSAPGPARPAAVRRPTAPRPVRRRACRGRRGATRTQSPRPSSSKAVVDVAVGGAVAAEPRRSRARSQSNRNPSWGTMRIATRRDAGVDLAQVDAADLDPPVRRVGEPRQQLRERGLAAPGLAHDRDVRRPAPRATMPCSTGLPSR